MEIKKNSGGIVPVPGRPGVFRTPSGHEIRVMASYPRFVSIRTPWTGRPPQGAEWVLVDIRAVDEDSSGHVRVVDAARNEVLWEADKRVLVDRAIAQREVSDEMRRSASYLYGVTETWLECAKEDDATVADLRVMEEALGDVTRAWYKAYEMVAGLHLVPMPFVSSSSVLRIDCEGHDCELHLVVIEKRPLR